MQDERYAAVLQPFILQGEVLGTSGTPIRKGGNESGYKRANDKQVAKIADKVVKHVGGEA